MSCFLCGREKEGSHHLGCPRIGRPDLSEAEAIEMGLMSAPEGKETPESKTEVLKEGSMTTVPEDEPEETDDVTPEEGVTVEQCEFEGCDNPKYNDHPRTKYCEVHKDPKNRKE